MKVTVRLYGTFKEAAGAGTLNEDMVEGATLGELLSRLATRHGPEFSNLASADSGILIICSGKATRDLTQKLEADASITLVPAIMGGSILGGFSPAAQNRGHGN